MRMTDPHALAMAQAVADAIEKADGAPKLAAALGLSRWAPHEWKKVPDRHVRRVAEITGIPCHQLRPDLYEAPAHSLERV
jgi:hypothetical protein